MLQKGKRKMILQANKNKKVNFFINPIILFQNKDLLEMAVNTFRCVLKGKK